MVLQFLFRCHIAGYLVFVMEWQNGIYSTTTVDLPNEWVYGIKLDWVGETAKAKLGDTEKPSGKFLVLDRHTLQKNGSKMEHDRWYGTTWKGTKCEAETVNGGGYKT